MGSFIGQAKAFLFGPEYITITGDISADLEEACKKASAVPNVSTDGSIVEVSLGPPVEEAAEATEEGISAWKPPAKAGGPPPAIDKAAFKCSSALGTQLRARSIGDFDQNRQVYSKQELSPLPFQPPAFFTYATTMLAGTLKVFQYVVTVLVALMVMQHAVERYWRLQHNTSSWQALLFALFISYPMITLLLVVLTNNEMAIRRFMYYRLMSLQVIVDFENAGFWRLWFFTYFTASFVLLLIYSFWAGWLTSDDKTVSVWPQLSIVGMQSLLLFNTWLNIISMEEQLVPLNKVIENSPNSAKELIQHSEVVEEADLKKAITNTYRRKRAFKRLSLADQDRAGRQLSETGDSAAAFFDLNALRQTSSKRRTSKEEAAEAAPEGCCGCFNRLQEWVTEIMWRKLYALIFATYFWSPSMFRLHRSGHDRAVATMWCYPGDRAYFRMLSLLSGICASFVIAVEAYAIWFVVFANATEERDKYGILECKMCYQFQSAAGETCVSKPNNDPCWGAATRGYCSMLTALVDKYALNSTLVRSWDTAYCAPLTS